jgi:adenylate cyclase, class 2
MALEIEIKLRVEEHETVRSRLEVAGAHRVGKRLETNTFLDTPQDKLLKAGAGLRVRRHCDVETQQASAVITHKGPRQPGAIKTREETEIEISSYADGVKLLEELGYHVKLSFEKRREIWDLGDCEVVLDEMPEGLGLFVEIEGPSEASVRAIRTQLELDGAVMEPSGYAVLIAKHLQGTGRSVVTFGD